MKYILNFTIVMFFILLSVPAYSKVNSSPILLDLNDVEIISASKEKEPAFTVATSIYVLSSDDIRRSGAINIPEALRLVPGIEVSRASSSKWSVTSRGFGRLYDNKILVLIDGRELYSSLFSGTNWDITDVILEDVDRIEIIRGPSPTLWGANTLNGVINVITKKAQYTQGNYASLLYGNKERSAEYRYGGSNKKNNIFYRAFAKELGREGVKAIDPARGNQFANAGDDWAMGKAGFRVDWQKTLRDEITFEGDAHSGKENQILFIPTIETSPVYDSEKVSGFNLDSRWKHIINETDNFNLHFYIDNTSRRSALDDINRNIFNLDGEYHLQTSRNNKIKIGLGYRYTMDEMKDSWISGLLVNQYAPGKENTALYNAFLQDSYSIIPETLEFIFGSKFEHHYITGSHFMPSAQLKWMPDDQNIIWTSVSSGIREPSKLETNLRRLATNDGATKIYWKSNPNFKAEKMNSYEIGYRNRSLSKLELDLSAFYNQYNNARSFEPDLTNFQYQLYNKANYQTEGINSSANINILNDWNVVFGYSYLDMNISFDHDSEDSLSHSEDAVSPHHQFQIQSRFNLGKTMDLDAYFYYLSDLRGISIKSYKRTDLRFAYRPIPNLELSIVGQKLFYGDTREITRAFYFTQDATYGNQIYANIKWKF